MQKITNDDQCDGCEEKGRFSMEAVLTPCHDDNVYLKVTFQTDISTIRSVPKSDDLGETRGI